MNICYLYEIMLLQLLNNQPLGVSNIFCLIRIVGIAAESQIVYFQIQFISVNVDDSDLSTIQSCQVNLLTSIKRKERL